MGGGVREVVGGGNGNEKLKKEAERTEQVILTIPNAIAS